MRDGRDPLGFEIGDGLGDLVAEIDAAHALIPLLDARRLAVDLDLEPDAADASGLHREVAGLAGNAGVGLVAANDGVERAVAAHLLVNDDIDHDVAFGSEAEFLEVLHGEDVARDAALHVAGTAPVDAAVLDRRRPRIVAPALAITGITSVWPLSSSERPPPVPFSIATMLGRPSYPR